nr:MAG TPA: hypothetical protein [Caudoviricetes sp.]
MIIYQIHKYEGEYEDYSDTIVSSYLDYNKALSEKERLEQEELGLREQGKKCANCPYIGYYYSTEGLIDVDTGYCSEASLENTNYGIECNNYFSHWDDATFEILEVNVIE